MWGKLLLPRLQSLRRLHVEVRVSMQQALVSTLEDNLAFVQANERKKMSESLPLNGANFCVVQR